MVSFMNIKMKTVAITLQTPNIKKVPAGPILDDIRVGVNKLTISTKVQLRKPPMLIDLLFRISPM